MGTKAGSRSHWNCGCPWLVLLIPGEQASLQTQHFRCWVLLVISKNIYFADKFLILADKAEGLTTLKNFRAEVFGMELHEVDKKSCKKHFTGSSEPRGDKL